MNPSFLYLSTGSPNLDRVLKGGWERGSGAFIFGKKGTGKSRLALSTAITAIKKGFKVFYLDSESNVTIAQLTDILEANGIKIGEIKIPQSNDPRINTKMYQAALLKELEKVGLTLVKTHNFLETWTRLDQLAKEITPDPNNPKANLEGKPLKYYDLIVIDSVTAHYIQYIMETKKDGIQFSKAVNWNDRVAEGRRKMFSAIGDCQSFMVSIINSLHQAADKEKFVILMTGQPVSEASEMIQRSAGVDKGTAEKAATEGGGYVGGKAVEYPPKTVIQLIQTREPTRKLMVIETHRNIKPGTYAEFTTTEKGVM